VRVEGVVLGIESLLFEVEERRDPVLVALVEAEGQMDELVQLTFGADGEYFYSDGGRGGTK
jgi:hypothetical protein